MGDQKTCTYLQYDCAAGDTGTLLIRSGQKPMLHKKNKEKLHSKGIDLSMKNKPPVVSYRKLNESDETCKLQK